MKVPGAQFFILNSAKVIQDLLIKRSTIYSHRPHSTMLNDLIGTAWLIPFMNNTDKWREYRRLFRREFDTVDASAVNKAHETQAARRLLRRLLTSTDHEGELRLAAVDAILSMTYGISPKDLHHPFINAPEDLNAIFADVARGGYIVDLFPFLRHLPAWFPGIRFHKTAKRGKDLANTMLMGPYIQVQEEMAGSTAASSVASRFLSGVQDGLISEAEQAALQNVCANTYLGGADTTVCALYNFTVAMALYPDVQTKAQKSLDAVLDGCRLPDFSDFTQLPYLSAVINEVLRWHPVTPFAIYHVSTEDDTYQGYHIPKGAMMIPNTWAILRDETIFGPDTDKFIPERFAPLVSACTDSRAPIGANRPPCSPCSPRAQRGNGGTDIAGGASGAGGCVGTRPSGATVSARLSARPRFARAGRRMPPDFSRDARARARNRRGVRPYPRVQCTESDSGARRGDEALVQRGAEPASYVRPYPRAHHTDSDSGHANQSAGSGRGGGASASQTCKRPSWRPTPVLAICTAAALA
ncbi:cytochrome P450 [Mycena belliarum]|uniref:Cytochrome P450 n=1 Tax=Mycena belliarum TaxID=1033014 RepID=A0AAD6TU02_9AGAR|nr:cytochrome P450 [Mycena belliae]